MNKKTNKKKLNPYTEKKNSEPLVEIKEAKIIEDIDLPETKSLTLTKEFDKPMVSVEEAKRDWELYQSLMKALIKEGDVAIIRGKKKATKQGYQKISRFWGYSSEPIKEKKEIEIADKDIWKRLEGRNVCVVKKGEPITIWKVWVKVIAPNGRYATRGATCASAERPFNNPYHDINATAQTRAFKSAVDALSGIDLELFEEGEEQTEQKPNNQPANLNKRKTEFQEYEFNGRKYKRKIIDGKVVQEGIEADAWMPMYKASGYPTNPALPVSEAQKEWILDELTANEIDPLGVIFVLGRRPNTREVKIDKLTKGDAFDIICAIKKDEFEKLIMIEKKEIPIAEPLEESEQ